MDYIDYELSKLNKLEALSDNMNKLGITDYEEYANYIENLKAEQEILMYESIHGY